jgi:hypothetical protein
LFSALRVACCVVFAARACFCLFLSVAGVVGVEASFFWVNFKGILKDNGRSCLLCFDMLDVLNVY